MRGPTLCIALAAAAIGCGGCLFIEDGKPLFVRTLDREMKDLRSSLERGAITLDEYERQKEAMLASYQGADFVLSRPLTDQEAERSLRGAKPAPIDGADGYGAYHVAMPTH